MIANIIGTSLQNMNKCKVNCHSSLFKQTPDIGTTFLKRFRNINLKVYTQFKHLYRFPGVLTRQQIRPCQYCVKLIGLIIELEGQVDDLY